MEIKKTHAYIVSGIIIVAVLAYIGNRIWNTLIIPNIAGAQEASTLIIFAIALGGGLVTFFTPCGIALLPAFLSYNLAAVSENGEGEKGEQLKLVKYLGKLGIFATLGMMTFFAILGAGFAVIGSAVNTYITPINYIIAVLLIIFGILLYRNTPFVSRFFEQLKHAVHKEAMKRTGYKAYYIFGFAYGLDAIGCLFPLVFGIIITPLLAGNLFIGVGSVILYSIGVAVMLTLFAYGIARGKTAITNLPQYSQVIRKIAAAGLFFGGIILLFYYKFWGMII